MTWDFSLLDLVLYGFFNEDRIPPTLALADSTMDIDVITAIEIWLIQGGF